MTKEIETIISYTHPLKIHGLNFMRCMPEFESPYLEKQAINNNGKYVFVFLVEYMSLLIY